MCASKFESATWRYRYQGHVAVQVPRGGARAWACVEMDQRNVEAAARIASRPFSSPVPQPTQRKRKVGWLASWSILRFLISSHVHDGVFITTPGARTWYSSSGCVPTTQRREEMGG